MRRLGGTAWTILSSKGDAPWKLPTKCSRYTPRICDKTVIACNPNEHTACTPHWRSIYGGEGVRSFSLLTLMESPVLTFVCVVLYRRAVCFLPDLPDHAVLLQIVGERARVARVCVHVRMWVWV